MSTKNISTNIIICKLFSGYGYVCLFMVYRLLVSSSPYGIANKTWATMVFHVIHTSHFAYVYTHFSVFFTCVYSQNKSHPNSFHTQNCLINRRCYWSNENTTVCVRNWASDLEIIMKEKLKVDWYIPSIKWPVGRDGRKSH